jgi:hypothetical protein
VDTNLFTDLLDGLRTLVGILGDPAVIPQVDDILNTTVLAL